MARKRNETRVDLRKKDTKERFLQFALDEMGKTGYLNFNYGDTAKSFGIASSALYNYFDDKEHLFRELLKIASARVFERYREECLEKVDLAKPIDALALFGQYIFSMFLKEKHLMDFLFFSPTALGVYAGSDGDVRMSFDMLREIHRLTGNIVKERLVQSEVEVLLVKWWSFMHGYTMLVSAGIIEAEEYFIRDVIADVIAGDNLKAVVEKISVKSSLLPEGDHSSFYYPPKRPGKTEIPKE